MATLIMFKPTSCPIHALTATVGTVTTPSGAGTGGAPAWRTASARARFRIAAGTSASWKTWSASPNNRAVRKVRSSGLSDSKAISMTRSPLGSSPLPTKFRPCRARDCRTGPAGRQRQSPGPTRGGAAAPQASVRGLQRARRQSHWPAALRFRAAGFQSAGEWPWPCPPTRRRCRPPPKRAFGPQLLAW